MSFSRQISAQPTLKWIDAKSIMAKHRHHYQNASISKSNKHTNRRKSKSNGNNNNNNNNKRQPSMINTNMNDTNRLNRCKSSNYHRPHQSHSHQSPSPFSNNQHRKVTSHSMSHQSIHSNSHISRNNNKNMNNNNLPRNSITGNTKLEMQTSLLLPDNDTETDSENDNHHPSNINTKQYQSNGINYHHHFGNSVNEQEFMFSPPSNSPLLLQQLSCKHSMHSFPFTRGILPRQHTYDQIKKCMQMSMDMDNNNIINNNGDNKNNNDQISDNDESEIEGIINNNDVDHRNKGGSINNRASMTTTINSGKTQPPPFDYVNQYQQDHQHENQDNVDNLTVNILTSDDEEEDDDDEDSKNGENDNDKGYDNDYKNEYEEEPAQIDQEDSLSTIISIPANPNALQHQTETISEISAFDNIHDLDPQDIDNVGNIDINNDNIDNIDNIDNEMLYDKYRKYAQYDGYHGNFNYNKNEHIKLNSITQTNHHHNVNNIDSDQHGLINISTSDSSSFDSGHANLAIDDGSSCDQIINANNNMSNNDDSDLNRESDLNRSGHSNYGLQSDDMDSIENHRSDSSQSGNSKCSGCPIYNIVSSPPQPIQTPVHDKTPVHDNNAVDIISDQERNVFKSLQNKLIEMDDFNQNYLNLRNEYLYKKSKIGKDRRINLNRTKQKISETFDELYQLIKQRENTLIFELDEIYKSQSNINNNIDQTEENNNNELQRLVREHMAHLSRQIDHYEAVTNPNINSSTKSMYFFLFLLFFFYCFYSDL